MKGEQDLYYLTRIDIASGILTELLGRWLDPARIEQFYGEQRRKVVDEATAECVRRAHVAANALMASFDAEADDEAGYARIKGDAENPRRNSEMPRKAQYVKAAP